MAVAPWAALEPRNAHLEGPSWLVLLPQLLFSRDIEHQIRTVIAPQAGWLYIYVFILQQHCLVSETFFLLLTVLCR